MSHLAGYSHNVDSLSYQIRTEEFPQVLGNHCVQPQLFPEWIEHSLSVILWQNRLPWILKFAALPFHKIG